jgi:hypothetical protein
MGKRDGAQLEGRATRRRPNHATVVAYLALFAALGGGSFAVASLSGKEKKVVKKIAAKQVERLSAGLSVNHADSADTATSADHAATADAASTATNADHATSADTASTAANADHAISAQSASTATNADHATSADTAATASDSEKAGGGAVCRSNVTLVAGAPDQVVCASGPLSLSVRCVNPSGGNFVGSYVIETSQDNAFFDDTTFSGDTRLDVADGKATVTTDNTGDAATTVVRTSAIAVDHPASHSQIVGTVGIRVSGPSGSCDFATFVVG